MILYNEIFCDWGHVTAPLRMFCLINMLLNSQQGDLKKRRGVKEGDLSGERE